jgi:hypothetical protein
MHVKDGTLDSLTPLRPPPLQPVVADGTPQHLGDQQGKALTTPEAANGNAAQVPGTADDHADASARSSRRWSAVPAPGQPAASSVSSRSAQGHDRMLGPLFPVSRTQIQWQKPDEKVFTYATFRLSCIGSITGFSTQVTALTAYGREIAYGLNDGSVGLVHLDTKATRDLRHGDSGSRMRVLALAASESGALFALYEASVCMWSTSGQSDRPTRSATLPRNSATPSKGCLLLNEERKWYVV